MNTKRQKSQNAIEFLITHAWSILLIMIVLGVLFWFGVLNARSSQPRGPPGDCAIFRPNGPGSLEEINPVGVCDGELPEFVARFGFFSGSGVTQFGNSNVTIASTHYMPVVTKSSIIVNHRGFTMTGWAYPYAPQPYSTLFTYGNFSVVNLISGHGNTLVWNAMYINIDGTTSGGNFCNNGLAMVLYNVQTCIYNQKPRSTWIFVAMEVNATDTVGYAVINGNTYVGTNLTSQLNNNFIIYPASATLISSPFSGVLTNIQLYNNSLSQNDLHSLYQEGLAGVPIDLQYLVGWWPLNGNLNDYSGNGNNGYTYNSADISGAYDNNYTAP